MQFTGKTLVESKNKLLKARYKVIESVLGFDDGAECIICKTLNPDFSIILPSLSLIITETGSPLSHLAILARERNIPVLLVPEILQNIPQKGKLNFENNKIELL